MIAAGCGKRPRLTGRGARGLARAVGLFVVVAIAVSCEGDSGSSVLAPETAYEVQVRGVRGAGEAPVWSVGVNVKTLGFAAPRRFRVSARGAGSVRAAWEAEAGLRYVLGYRAKGARQWTELTMKQGPKTVRGLKADTAYRFRLLAEKASGGEIHRSASARADARTLAASGSEEDE